MRKAILAGLLVVAVFAASAQPVKITPDNVRLEDLVGSSTLVTVVIKGLSAKDPNLRIIEILPDSFITLDQNNERTPYLFETVEEIQVQGGEVQKPSFELTHARTLKGPERQIVERAGNRAREIYQGSAGDQIVRIKAALALCLAGDTEAREYLLRLAKSGDVETELIAVSLLYLAGDESAKPGAPYPLKVSGASEEAASPLIPDVTKRGLQHGNRKVRAVAAILAGLTNDTDSLPMLRRMLNDRLTEINTPAARALANMGDKESVPRLLELVMERDPEKGEAAIYALKRLGDASTVEQIKAQLPLATGEVHFRLARILFHFKDPLGRELMVKAMNEIPTLAPQAALCLAEQGDLNAKVFLHDRLDAREDKTKENMEYRAKAAAALILGGDPTGGAVLADLLRQEDEMIIGVVCDTVAELGRANLLTIIQPPLESANTKLAIDAALTVLALADNDFRERLVALNQSE